MPYVPDIDSGQPLQEAIAVLLLGWAVAGVVTLVCTSCVDNLAAVAAAVNRFFASTNR